MIFGIYGHMKRLLYYSWLCQSMILSQFGTQSVLICKNKCFPPEYPSKTLVLGGGGGGNRSVYWKNGTSLWSMQNLIFVGLLLKFGLVKNKTEAYLLCVNTLINHFCYFREFSLNFSFRKFLLQCMGWFSLKLWEVIFEI